MSDAAVLEVALTAPGVRAAFSTRSGGVSTGGHASLNIGTASGDAPEAVRENRRRLALAAGFDPGRAACLRQVHGCDVHEVVAAAGEAFLGGPDGVADADALVTSSPGMALVVQGADCVPVLLWRSDGTRVGAAHAGWRGLVGGVVARAVEAVGEPATLGAAIGPCIAPCCYPVDAELRATMAERFGSEVVRGEAVDLRAGARVSLRQVGLPDAAIIDVPGCTACDPGRFFSYRRDGEATGRQAGVIWMEER